MLKDKKLFLFDIDGTLSVENTLYKGSAELLGLIEEYGGKAYFITNNSTKSNADYVKKFAAWNIETSMEQFVTAGYMTKKMLLKRFNKGELIFVLGTESFVGELKETGLNITTEVLPDVKCVLVAYDSELSYEKLVKACELLSRDGVAYFATNPDLVCPASFGFIPDCGGICKMLEYATKRTPIFIGKPNKEVVECCMASAGITDREKVLVVGDRLYTDIACGVNAGVETCVVYTGEASPEDIETSEWKPDYCYENIEKLYEALIKERTFAK